MTKNEITLALNPPLPLWVCEQIFPNYFKPVSEQLERPPAVLTMKWALKRLKTTLFSERKATQITDLIMSAVTIPYTSDPTNLVKFRIENGHIITDYMHLFHVTTPGMVTCFPKLVPEISLHTYKENAVPNCPPEIDLMMKGAGTEQNKFKAFMDKLDDALLNFVVNHQNVLGKANNSLTRAQVEMMMKCQFCPHVSIKTSKTYPDVQTCRYKCKEHPLQVIDSSCKEIDLASNPTSIRYNNIVCVRM